MKKIILSLLILVTISSSCSSEDNNSNNSEIQINPPSWIQGTWLLQSSVAGESGWRFTKNDVINIQASVEISQRGQLEPFLKTDQIVSATDESTPNTYKVTSNFPFGQTTILSFTRVSDIEITWDAVSNSIYTKK
jgi:hypothetical protein